MVVYIGLIAAIVGSFISMLTYRLPIMMEQQWQKEWQQEQEQQQERSTDSDQETQFNLAKPASHCPHCQQAITWRFNIPIIGFLLSKGRCHHCQKSISWRYIGIELATLAITLLLVWQLGMTATMLAMVLASWLLIALSVIDIEHGLLPDNLTLSLLWLGLLCSSLGLTIDLKDAVWGAAIGYLSLWSLYQIMKRISGREGMGYGDFKLAAAIGAWVGWQALPIIMLLASLTALIYALWQIASKRWQIKSALLQQFGFGPFLATAFWLTIFFQEHMQQGLQWLIAL